MSYVEKTTSNIEKTTSDLFYTFATHRNAMICDATLCFVFCFDLQHLVVFCFGLGLTL